MEKREVVPNSLWRHFKGTKYMVIAVAKHTETGEKQVVYHAADGNSKEVYARPLDMFLSEVDHEKYPNVSQKYRFEEIK